MKLCENGHPAVCFDDNPDGPGKDCPVCEEIDKRHDLQRDLSATEERLEAVLARRVGCGMGRLADEVRAVT